MICTEGIAQVDDSSYTNRSTFNFCSSDAVLRNLRKDADFTRREEQLNRFVVSASRNLTDTIITLPVVVHIISDNPDSISNAYIQQGISDLNDAFGKNGTYSTGDGVDTRIRFCLAKTDENGRLTTGITRTFSILGNDMNMDNEDLKLKSLSMWDPSLYINIWLVRNIKGESYADFHCGTWYRLGVSGYAAMPPVDGSVDGIVTTAFGQVLAHQMGHYLGLYHTFENGCRNMDCTTDGDRVCDTPPDNSVRPSSSCINPDNTCGTDILSNFSNGAFPLNVPDQISNFMDFGNSACSNTFTAGQAARMRAVINLYRGSLPGNRCNAPCTDNIITKFTKEIPLPSSPQAVNFINATTGALNFQWILNGNVVSTNRNLSYTFIEGMEYSVELKAFSASGCFSSYTEKIIMNCGITARFFADKKAIASLAGLYTDSIVFTNTSLNATSSQWIVSNNHGLPEMTINDSVNLTYVFPEPGEYKVRLIAINGSCTDTTENFIVNVLDPTPDGGLFNVSLQCYDETKIRVRFCLSNYGFAPIPSNTPVSFYDRNPSIADARKLSPSFSIPDSLDGGNCYTCYTHILNEPYSNIDRVYVVFNDAGNSVPVALPNTLVSELLYTNNMAASASNSRTVNITLCEGENYAGYTQSGIYTDTFTSVRNGCDSVRKLNLTVLPVFRATRNVEICSGETFEGHTSSGTYISRFTSSNGCDSILTLELIVKPVMINEISAVICEGETYEGYSSPGRYTNTFSSSNGCNSTRILNLAVNPVKRTDVNISLCEGSSYNGHTQSGIFSDTLTSANGCDSIVTIHLAVKQKANSTVSVSVCNGDTYGPYSASGVYIDTLVAANGCDSIRILHLNVWPSPHQIIYKTICNGASFEGYSSTGIYTDTFTTVNGCDSIRVLNLTVKQPVINVINATICRGENYEGYNQTGIYSDVLLSSGGCDSTRTLNLTVLPVSGSVLNMEICSGSSYLGFMQAGIYTDTLRNVYGCDSIRTLNLFVRENPVVTLNVSICEGESYESYSRTGIYSDTFLSAFGCDSTRVLHLTVNPVPRTELTISICEGDSYSGYSTPGIYVDTLISSLGCDSIRTIRLSVKPVLHRELNVQICEGESFEGYSVSGSYTNNFISSFGCDSTRTLNLLVKPVSRITNNIRICEGETYFAQGSWQSTAGIYRDTLRSVSGCDSIVSTNLLVSSLPQPQLGEDRNICFGQTLDLSPGNFASYLWNNGSQNSVHNVADTGLYIVTVINANGCSSSDSVRINRILQPLKNLLPADTALCNGNTLKLNVPGFLTYAWDNGSSLAYRNITLPGEYRLTVQDGNGCLSTDSIRVEFSDCITIMVPGAFTPGKDGLNDVFRPVIQVNVSNYKMQIFHRSGLLLFSSNDHRKGWDGTYKGSLQSPGGYVYLITLNDSKGDFIKRAGSFLLLR